jgi:D-3-phosphoglycerate dehydrogenase
VAKWKVVITDSGYKHYDIERGVLRAVGADVTVKQCTTEEEVIALARDADGVIVRLQPFSDKVQQALPKCRAVGRYGIGVDNIDVEAATRNGIAVGNVVDYAVNEVSEQALALIFSCARKTTSHDKRIRKGEWDIGAKDPIHRVQGRTLGLVGLGRIPQTLVRKVKGFEFRIIASDPFVSKDDAKKLGVELVDFDTLLKESDFVSIHAPLNDKTRHMINESTLRRMKPTAILVNTARGGVVDTKALYKALREGWINSAGLDVHETEPAPEDYCMFELENVVIADHAGWYSEESMAELQRGAAEAVAAVLTGGWPRSLVNPKVKDTYRAKWGP